MVVDHTSSNIGGGGCCIGETAAHDGGYGGC